MNEILKKNGLPTEGSVDITINLIKLIAEQYAKEKVKDANKLAHTAWKRSVKHALRIKELEERISILDELLKERSV